jgi:PAS domain S-box-containing protein
MLKTTYAHTDLGKPLLGAHTCYSAAMLNVRDLFKDPSFLELMPTAVYIVDANGLIHGFNKRACEFWGQTPKLYDNHNRFCGAFKLTNADGSSLPHDKTPMAAALELGLSFKNAEVGIIRPDGSKIMVRVNITPLRDENGVIVGAINAFQDISEILESRRKVEAQIAELEMRDSFMSICSHELKTPLTVLKAQAQMALLKLSKNDETAFDKNRAKLMIVQNIVEFDKLTRLVNDMLDLQRIKSGSLDMTLEKFELGPLIRHLVESTVTGLGESESKLHVHVTDPIEGMFDRVRMEQVMNNLVSNALKYGDNGPIEVDVSKSDGFAKIQIRDQGIGIAKTDQDRIFERFERANNATKIGGLGLGLFVTKQIVDAHNGKIYVESDLGKGSTFFVEIPLIPSALPSAALNG